MNQEMSLILPLSIKFEILSTFSIWYMYQLDDKSNQNFSGGLSQITKNELFQQRCHMLVLFEEQLGIFIVFVLRIEIMK